MNKKLLALLGLLSGAAIAATSYTTHYNLAKPGDGDINWGSSYRDNLDTIDTQLNANATGIQDHIDDTVGAHAASAISATSGTLCASEDTVQEFLDCLDSNFNSIVGGTVVTTNTTQTITGAKTFSGGLTISAGNFTIPTTDGVLKADSGGIVTASPVVDADVDPAAAISYSKLDLAGSIVSGDIVDGTIVNDDVSASAAIARSKLASGTASHVLINDGSGVMSSEAQLAASRGGTGVDASAASNGQLLIGNGSGFALGTLTGTADQVTVTNGAGTVTLSLPQSIATTSDVTFDDVTGTTSVITPLVKASGAGGVAIQASNGTLAATLGASGGATTVFEGAITSKSSIGLRETGGGTDAVTLAAPSSTTGYTVTLPSSAPGSNTVLSYDGANYVWATGAGDVVGPASSVDGQAALFNATTGKLLKAFTGSGAVSASSGVLSAGTLSLANGGTAKGLTAAAGGVVYTDSDSMEVTAAGTSGDYLKSNGTSAPTWQSFATPTVQRFTSGSGTYTTPANVKWIKVTMVGGGAGGAGSGTATGTNPTAGGDSTFGSSLLTASGGGAGTWTAGLGGSGGSVTVNSPAIRVIGVAGGDGGSQSGNSSALWPGGNGGVSALGGAGRGGSAGGGAAGGPNSGSGGGGAGINAVASGYTGPGGGAGGYIEAIITSPSATYSYSVGAGGNAGGAGTSGSAGGAGGSGVIVVEEFYQ